MTQATEDDTPPLQHDTVQDSVLPLQQVAGTQDKKTLPDT